MLHKLGVPSTIWFYFKHISNIAFFQCELQLYQWLYVLDFDTLLFNSRKHGMTWSSTIISHACSGDVSCLNGFFSFLWPIISVSIYFVLKRHPPNPISLLSLWCMLTHTARILLKATKQYKGEQHHESFLTASSKCNLLCTMLTE